MIFTGLTFHLYNVVAHFDIFFFIVSFISRDYDSIKCLV